MSTTFVINGLVKKRAAMAGELEHLRQQMIQLKGEISRLDNAIQIFDPEYKIEDIKTIRKRTYNRFFEAGERTKAIMDTLRDAPEEGYSVIQIAEILCEQRGLELQPNEMDKFVRSLHGGIKQPLSRGHIREVSQRDGRPYFVISV